MVAAEQTALVPMNLQCRMVSEAHLLSGLKALRVKTVLTAEKKLVQLSGVALFPGDIAPDLPNLSGGTIEVNGEKRRIFQGRKARNPDGTVNYSELDVM